MAFPCSIHDFLSRKLRVCAILAWLTILAGAFHGALAGASQPTLTRLKLVDFGWQPLPRYQRLETPGMIRQLVAFDHTGRLLVGFTSRDNYVLATRDHPGLSFHILRFSLEGNLDLSLSLPTNNWFNNGFYLDSGDHILALANNSFQFLSDAEETPKEPAKWTTLRIPCPADCWVTQSPSRRTLLIKQSLSPNHSIRTYLDTSAALPRVVENCPSSIQSGVITDKFIYSPSDGISRDVFRWPICDQEHGVELPLDMRKGSVGALSDDALVLLSTGNDSRGIDLVSPNGQLKLHFKLPKYDSATGYAAPEIRIDEHGDRFAIHVETWRGGSWVLDISGHRVARRIVVFTASGQQLASVPVNTNYHNDFDYSLSPDGHRLAILDDGLLTMVNLG